MSSKYYQAYSAVNSCGPSTCFKLKESLEKYYSVVKECMNKGGSDQIKMVKITIPTQEGLSILKKDVEELNVDLVKIDKAHDLISSL